MRLKLTQIRGQTSTFFPSSTRTYQDFPPPPLPTAPSCSKWFSCTSCCPNRPSTSSNIPDKLDRPKGIPHLPLPPTLPYSPTSLPFLRHLQILDLALLSTPKESWQIYWSLHSSLRRYIPDRTFSKLISHQLNSSEAEKDRWIRLKNLIKLAMEFDMDVGQIGRENVESILRLALNLNAKDVKVVRWLWKGTGGFVKGDLGRIPIDIRISWLKWADLSARALFRTAGELVSSGGGRGLEEILERNLHSLCSPTKVYDNQMVLKRIVEYWNNDVKLSPAILVRVSKSFIRCWNDQDVDVESRLRSTIREETLRLNPDTELIHLLDESMEEAIVQCQSPVQRIPWALESDLPGIKLVFHAFKALSSLSTEKDVVGALNSIIRLCEVAISKRDVDVQSLIKAILSSLHLNHPTNRKQLDGLIVSFTRSIINTSILPHLPSVTAYRLLDLNASVQTSLETHNILRQIYPFVRSGEVPVKWTQKNLKTWQRVFKTSLETPKRNMYFASRLYADLQADGVMIGQSDFLAFIKAISGSETSSRAVLLERHLKDWISFDFDYEERNALCLAMTEGLTSTTKANDALLALDLTQRILQHQSIPDQIIRIIATRLSRSTQISHQMKSLSLLNRLPDSPELVKLYSTIMANFILCPPNSVSNYDENLSRAIEAYKTIRDRNLVPDTRSVSLLVRGLVESGRLENALIAFRHITESGVILNSNVVGQLMVNLIVKERLDEAEQVESSWRALVSEGERWDKGVIGARVFLDIKRGVKVDLNQVEKKTGWKPNRHFRKFINDNTTLPEVVPQSVDDAEKMSVDVEGHKHKQRIQPITKSLLDEGGSGWSLGSGWKGHGQERTVGLDGCVGLVAF